MRKTTIITHTLICAFLAAALGSGCGGGKVPVSEGDNNDLTDAGGADGGGTSDVDVPNLEGLDKTLVSAECSMIFKCCSSGEIEDRYGFSSEEDCDVNNALFGNAFGFEAFSVAIQEGRIEFDEQMATLCANSFPDAACEDWTETNPLESDVTGCIEAITPKTSVGENCKFEFECIDSYCEASVNEDEPGVCTAYVAEGESCADPNDLCAEGLYCDTFFADAVCVARRDVDEACLEDVECLSDNCVTEAGGDKSCQAEATVCALQ